MVSMSALVLASAAVAATFVQHASAHTNMLFPKPLFPPGEYDGNSPYARMDSTKLPGDKSIPAHMGVKRIASAMEASTDKTLRGLIYKYATTTYDKECGKTLMTGAKHPVPAEIDFPWGHAGPCEAWCDDTKIFADGDCQGNNVGKIKVDQTKCANAKRLQVMYAGVHVSNYEIYSNCVPLGGAGSGGSGGAAPSPAKTPAVTTKAPSAGGASTTKPAATTKPATSAAPKPATPAATPKTKCKRRLR